MRCLLLVAGMATVAFGVTPTNLQPGPNPNCPAPWTQQNGKDSCFDCCNWARLGQCTANKEWMLPYCQESCGSTGCAVGSSASCTVKVKSICSGTNAGATAAPSNTNTNTATNANTATGTGQQIVLNILLSPSNSSSAASTTKTTTAKPAAGGLANLFLIPLNLASLGASSAGATSAGGAPVTTTTTTTAAPPKVNFASLPIYLLQVPASGLTGLTGNAAAAAAAATTTTTAAPSSNINLSNINLSSIPVILLTPAQRRARALQRLRAKRRRARLIARRRQIVKNIN